MLCLIKDKNIFGQFYGDVYIIKYQKCSFFYIYLLIFLNKTDEFFEIFEIGKSIYIKLSIIEINFTSKLIRILTLIMLYSPYRGTNP